MQMLLILYRLSISLPVRYLHQPLCQFQLEERTAVQVVVIRH